LLLVVATLTGWLPHASAVSGGRHDADGHHYVVAVLSEKTAAPSCSGVWTRVAVHLTVVVTDAHCVPAPRGARVPVYFGAQWHQGSRTSTGRSYRDPRYDRASHDDDIAVIRLDKPPSVRPAVLAPRGTAVGEHTVTTVGFGLPHTGQRWKATEIVTSHSTRRLYLRSGSGNSCTGDSGGPDLMPGRSAVVALTDVGSCSRDKDTRLDTTKAQTFLAAQQ
jgi:hypothetical protein